MLRNVGKWIETDEAVETRTVEKKGKNQLPHGTGADAYTSLGPSITIRCPRWKDPQVRTPCGVPSC